MDVISSILDQFGLLVGLGMMLAAAVLIGVTGDHYTNKPAHHINIPLAAGCLILVVTVIS